MAIQRRFIGLASVTILVIGIVFFGSVPQATAETLTFKAFNHATKSEMIPIPDVEGHNIIAGTREGAALFQSGEWAWIKSVAVYDLIKGTGPLDGYATYTFLDGSTLTTRMKGTLEATPQGASSTAKYTGDIIHGTGRFQGIKGTMTTSGKVFPTEKGELGPKALVEGTLVYTLPGK